MAAKVLIDADQFRRTVARIAHEIVEHHPDTSAIALVGLHTRGVPLEERSATWPGPTWIGPRSPGTPRL